jgi:hypothetical protein
VLQDGGVLRLGAEAGDEGRVPGVLAAQDLDRDGPAQQEVAGPPHLAHAAGGQQPEELVAARERRAPRLHHR